jgi:hypothetical protein
MRWRAGIFLGGGIGGKFSTNALEMQAGRKSNSLERRSPDRRESNDILPQHAEPEFGAPKARNSRLTK